ncbi:hypothetical protein DOTSEDRAFT_49287 [Dothistroma septosporum NZE10]|uniref:Uncharacterized protein n=1 Tax=Dothistroma septosporum (strain NZE10 / CBS 128990) TaxID=675120 RepID=N1PZP8_DOTSN|nr:hypothetical protein DOTSEDRAFT_49287 [Dothistroma septosporum NZE10]
MGLMTHDQQRSIQGLSSMRYVSHLWRSSQRRPGLFHMVDDDRRRALDECARGNPPPVPVETCHDSSVTDQLYTFFCDSRRDHEAQYGYQDSTAHEHNNCKRLGRARVFSKYESSVSACRRKI